MGSLRVAAAAERRQRDTREEERGRSTGTGNTWERGAPLRESTHTPSNSYLLNKNIDKNDKDNNDDNNNIGTAAFRLWTGKAQDGAADDGLELWQQGAGDSLSARLPTHGSTGKDKLGLLCLDSHLNLLYLEQSSMRGSWLEVRIVISDWFQDVCVTEMHWTLKECG